MTEQPEGPELKRLVETCATAAQKFVPMTGDPLHDEIAEAQRLVLQALLARGDDAWGLKPYLTSSRSLLSKTGWTRQRILERARRVAAGLYRARCATEPHGVSARR